MLTEETTKMSKADRDQMLVEWNDTRVDYPQDVCLHHLFEAQVEQTPAAVALVFEDQHLTYGELNHRANQLAYYLQKLGVGPEVLVGVFMERSFEMVISLYAILKAGGAYVPLDPEYPAERVAFMLEEIQAPVLLTQQHLTDKLSPIQNPSDVTSHFMSQKSQNPEVVCLDSNWTIIAQERSNNPASEVTAKNLAYVIYTSGSTGKPKGVMNEHRGICNRLLWMQDTYQLTETDHVLQKTPFSFDVSVWEFFWPLLVGARLVVAQAGGHKDSAYLVNIIVDQKITTIHFVPSMLQLFLADRDVEQCRSLKRVICSGEALPYALQERFFDRLDTELHNLYGPTEAAVDVTFWACQRESEYRIVPIGCPVANTQIYILDQQLEPVPRDAAGELHIGGVQVARGYLNRAELTLEKFIHDPFSDNVDARLYKTGDLARYLPDGNIEYLGRTDHQVKIRGFRIELGEIETILSQHPAVRETVVVDREDRPTEKYLVAYIVPKQEQTVSISELRHFLQEKLPEYMVPSIFVWLDIMPLTPNGKVNRRALPAPGQDRPHLETAYVEPRTDLERFLVNLWQDVLGLEKIGINDNFFELGGDSLKGMTFVNKLQAALDEYFYIIALFEAPMIASLADYLIQHYPNVLTKLELDGAQPALVSVALTSQINASKIEQMRQLIPVRQPGKDHAQDAFSKNLKAIFILSSYRSGSTLLRVMLAGHPSLFSPPELNLLTFNTLKERKAVYSGKESFRAEGAPRIIMDIKGCDVKQAKQILADYEAQNLSSKDFYQLVQSWVYPRILVDKSPSYALDINALKQAEIDFDEPLYIHLHRHPYGVISSFEEVRFDRLLFKGEHPFSVREIGELTWLTSHQNILEFLQAISDHRQHQLKFEDLVRHPNTTMEKICRFLNLEMHPDVLQPYKNKDKKMTDGLYPESGSKMIGDVKFHEHNNIEASIADRWQKHYSNDFLGDVTWQVAETLGYERFSRVTTEDTTQSSIKSIQSIQPADISQKDAEQLLAKLDELSDEEVDTMFDDMLGVERPNG